MHRSESVLHIGTRCVRRFAHHPSMTNSITLLNEGCWTPLAASAFIQWATCRSTTPPILYSADNDQRLRDGSGCDGASESDVTYGCRRRQRETCRICAIDSGCRRRFTWRQSSTDANRELGGFHGHIAFPMWRIIGAVYSTSYRTVH